MRRKVVIAGGRSKARSLALSMLKQGYEVTLINLSHQDCMELAMIESLTVIEGDATKPYVLEDAGIEGFDVAIALNTKDEDNLVICELCKTLFRVKKTVSLVNDPKKQDFFLKRGVDHVICALEELAELIRQQASVEEIKRVSAPKTDALHIEEVTIPKNAWCIDKPICALSLPDDVIVACINRRHDTIIPNGNTQLKAKDRLVVLTTENEKNAIQILTEKNGYGE